MNFRANSRHLLFAVIATSLLLLFHQAKLTTLPLALAQRLTHAARAGLTAAFQDFRSADKLSSSRSLTLATPLLDLPEKVKLMEENQKMRHLLSAPLPAAWHFLPARVVGLGPDFLVIDEGSQSQVTPGMAVVVADPDKNHRSGILVGQITTVSSAQSQVALPFSAHTNFPVQIISPSGATFQGRGLVIGDDTHIKITEVLNSEPAQTDDLVFTAPGKLAPDLFVGKISSLTSDPTGVYQEGSLTPALDYRQLDYVFIITAF